MYTADDIDEMNEPVICKYCNGKCMCPRCYMQERAKEDAKRKEQQ